MAPIVDKIKHALHLDGSSSSSTTAESKTTAPAAAEASPAASSTSAAADVSTSSPAVSETPAFGKEEVIVLFVLGGPGVGKGTQCANLVKDYHFVHLSAGDLLRAEQAREGSQYGQMIKEYIREGQIVPMEVTVKLLENAIRDALQTPPPQWASQSLTPRFLIDGFPRKMDQALKFDQSVCPSRAVLFFSATEDVMLERLEERGKTSGREDDNKESIVKRFRTFVETSMPVVKYYQQSGVVYDIPASGSKEDVYVAVRKAVDEILPPSPMTATTPAPATAAAAAPSTTATSHEVPGMVHLGPIA